MKEKTLRNLLITLAYQSLNVKLNEEEKKETHLSVSPPNHN